MRNRLVHSANTTAWRVLSATALSLSLAKMQLAEDEIFIYGIHTDIRYMNWVPLWRYVLELPGVYEHCKDLYENLHHPEVLTSIGKRICADPNYHRNKGMTQRRHCEHFSERLPRCRAHDTKFDIVVMQSIYYIVATFTKIKYCKNIEILGLYKQIDFC